MTLQNVSIAFLCLYAGTDAFLQPERSLMLTRSTTDTTTSPMTRSMSKNSDRAHIERNLEDAMDNDWRVFRASLVAQERAEKAESGNAPQISHPTTSHHGAQVDDTKSLQKQGQLSDMFSGAINSIFKNSAKKGINKRENIFAGDSIGGINDDGFLPLEDPFVSAEELPLLLKPKAKINKHRWAHEISHLEPGCVLIANEKLGGAFHQTVVLIIEHHESAGSIGVVINR
jgi:putative transcriptional regulator